jgi:hypothetical protein
MTDAQLASGALPAVLAEATTPQRLALLSANARQLGKNDPLTQILARIDSLVCGRGDG